MSSIGNVKQQVSAVGEKAGKTALQLSNLSKSFKNDAAAVINAIGGTASGEDKKLAQAFTQASDALNKAALSLQAASQSAKNWASKA